MHFIEHLELLKIKVSIFFRQAMYLFMHLMKELEVQMER